MWLPCTRRRWKLFHLHIAVFRPVTTWGFTPRPLPPPQARDCPSISMPGRGCCCSPLHPAGFCGRAFRHTTLPRLTSDYICFSSCSMLATLLASLGGVSAPFPHGERAAEPFVITSRLSSGYMSNCLTWCPSYFQMKYNLVWIFLSYLSNFNDIVRAIYIKKICASTQTLPMNFSGY